MNRLSWLERLRVRWSVWRGNRRRQAGFCPLCNSSPPDPACPVCQGSDDYGPYQSEPEWRRWRDRWFNLVGWPESGTKSLVVGHGQAPRTPPPPAPQPSTTWRCEECGWAWPIGRQQCPRCGNRTRERVEP